MSKFWKWVKNKNHKNKSQEGEERELFLDVEISDEVWWGDEVTPDQFRDELNAGSGDITVWVNSPGGSVFAAYQIYNMLRSYKGRITVKIDAIAASAASVIAMAGDQVLVSPVSVLMIHNPSTIAWGNRNDLQAALDMLDAIKESIINAYQEKTGLSHKKLSEMMDAEKYLDSKEAVSLGFADGIYERAFKEDPEPGGPLDPDKKDGKDSAAMLFSDTPFNPAKAKAIAAYCRERQRKEPADPGRNVSELYDRLDLMKKMF